MKKILLTGASGYIGKHIALQLLNEGYEVRASVRNLKRASEVKNAVLPYLLDPTNLDSRITFVELDLEKDLGWEEALHGIDVLMHTASPFPIASPKDESELIRPAVEGTLRALRAANVANVQRVILTSSTAAIMGCDLPANKMAFDETMWTDTSHPVGKIAYTKSKTMAEMAAWAFVKNEAPEMQLTSINPVMVLGAPLDIHFGSSISVIERIFKGKDPLLPDLQFAVVDVVDVAKMHVASIKNEKSIGERILASSETLSFVDIAKIMKANYPKSSIKTGKAPALLIKLLSFFDGEIKAILPLLGRDMKTSNSKAKTLFGIEFIKANDSVRGSAAFLIANGSIKL